MNYNEVLDTLKEEMEILAEEEKKPGSPLRNGSEPSCATKQGCTGGEPACDTDEKPAVTTDEPSTATTDGTSSETTDGTQF